ncbi:hypothetical protein COT77_00010 [Candidatus Berkelbacteria bacterium CG10_big_fil_rev_8_21_14_0_10_41_12]|uniref:Uncharacterized protein n=1 Tax=Candidatus Berkelbacteria bacterium CG10_big_fil_rev_8_21_14_0_10_41_12 TaxID=1974513 RepID=A0A2M6WY56_9BACT|nr:MAG: hypothetical protein COT77_00010 [Candidatus Berkelbacteria bacterium CG10_big_fil_rev_8_21_14_0_10_41_12]
MEISESIKEKEPRVFLRQFLLSKAEEKKAHLPKDVENNVLKHYQVVVDHLKQLPADNYPDVSDVITDLNKIGGKEIKFPNVGDQIDINGKFEILAIYPPETDALDAIMETPKATTFVAGTNFWDNPFNPRQVFLPGNYILSKDSGHL